MGIFAIFLVVLGVAFSIFYMSHRTDTRKHILKNKFVASTEMTPSPDSPDETLNMAQTADPPKNGGADDPSKEQTGANITLPVPTPRPRYIPAREKYFKAYKAWILGEYSKKGNISNPVDVLRKSLAIMRRAKSNATVGVVVAHYKEDLSWLDEWFPDDIEGVNVYVYSKGNEYINCSRRVESYTLPNVGMCDHTYLTHIIRKYEELDDQLLFLTDSVPFLTYKSAQVDMILEKMATNKGIVPWKEYDDETALEMDSLNIPEYCQAGINNVKSSRCKTARSEFRNYGAFRRYMLRREEKGKIARSRGAVYWGVFGAAKEAIIWRRKQLYENLLDSLSESIHPENAHYMERLWVDTFLGSILEQPKPEKEEQEEHGGGGGEIQKEYQQQQQQDHVEELQRLQDDQKNDENGVVPPSESLRQEQPQPSSQQHVGTDSDDDDDDDEIESPLTMASADKAAV